MFSFLFFWEIMALSSFLLVMTEFEKQETQKAGIFYFVMTHLSTLFLLFAFLFIYTQTGTFDMRQIQADPLIASVAFVFLFLAFGIKAGIIPFHKWLPYAHPASPSNISALMSGVMIKSRNLRFSAVCFAYAHADVVGHAYFGYGSSLGSAWRNLCA